MALSKHRKYWKERDKQNALRIYRYSNAQAEMVTRWFGRATREMEKAVSAFYRKYAEENQISQQEAKAVLNDTKAIKALSEKYEKLLEAYPDDPVTQKNLDLLYKSRAINREKFLQMQLDYIASDIFGKYADASSETLTRLYEESYYRGIFNHQQYMGFGSNFSRLSTNFIAAATSTSWSGKNYSETIWGSQRTSLARYMNRIITNGFIQGKDNRVMVAELRKAMNMSAYRARNLIRTDSSYVANQGNKLSYEQNGTQEYEYLSVLDFKTSEKCRKLDGTIHKVKEAKVGVNFPPMHNFCRSTTAPGDDPDYADTRVARDGYGNVYKVPADMQYPQWYEKHILPYTKERIAEMKYKNGTADAKQWARYRQVLGGNVPSTLDKFQNMKYTDLDEWIDIKRDYRQTRYYESHLTKAEKAAVERYISGGSYLLNAKLRANILPNDTEKQWIYDLDKALKKLPAFEGKVTRSLDLEGQELFDFLQRHMSGEQIIYPAYTSASVLPDYHENPNVLIFIESKTGKNLQAANKAEGEILFMRDTSFSIIDVRLEDKQVIIELEEFNG